MDRIFLDANVLFSAAYREDAGLLAFWKLQDVTLCSSRYAIAEANLNLEDLGQQRRLARLVTALHVIEAREHDPLPEIALPEKDWPILRAAIEAQATHLVTGDVRHFGRYFGKRLHGVLVLTPADFLKRRGKSRNG